jgi:hypothetical protein
MDTYTIQAFWATENLALCKEYTNGHTSMLTAHGFQHFKTNQTYWYLDPKVLVFIIKKSNEILGGMRVVAKSEGELLPLEQAITKLDKSIVSYIQSIEPLNPMESCGLWNSKKISGKNLSHILSRVPIAIAPFINCKAILSFNATYTFRITKGLGYSMVASIGNEGYFRYPTEDFRAAVWVHLDMEKLEKCSEDDRKKIRKIREYFGSDFSLKENEKMVIKYEFNI